MATFLDMQTRIANELDRPNLAPQIKQAIVSAVKFYERKQFYFSETSFTFNTVAGREYYGATDAPAIATSPNIERITGLFYGLRTPLTKRTFDYIDNISAMPISRAMPEDWAYRALQIRLYPIPNASYALTAFNVPRLDDLSADSDSNAWTNDAEELIRCRAKIVLIRDTIRGVDMVEEIALLKDGERDALNALRSETASREAVGYLQPTQF